jgi:hypothetical protein
MPVAANSPDDVLLAIRDEQFSPARRAYRASRACLICGDPLR